MTYYNQNRSFFCGNKLLIEAPSLIKEFLIIKNCIILLVEPSELESDKNIYCYNLKGKLKWQIGGEVTNLHKKNYFISIYVNEHGDFQAYNLNGVEITINLNNGAILKKELIR